MTIVSKTEPINQKKMLLLSAADDSPQFSKDYQAGLLAVLDVLRTEGIETEPQRFAQDGLGGEGGLSGEITVFNNRIPPGIVKGLANWRQGSQNCHMVEDFYKYSPPFLYG